jgi:hypothetical protein
MKKMIVAMVVAFTTMAMPALGQSTAAGEPLTKEAQVEKKVAVKSTALDTAAMDTMQEDSQAVPSHRAELKAKVRHWKKDWEDDWDDDSDNDSFGPGGVRAVAISGIIFGTMLPVLVLFIIFYFRYKNRQARYKLVEQALAAGQPLPEDFLNGKRLSSQRSTGIRNTFTGIGLFIFLWAITDEFGVGAIGLLVAFLGIGQWIVGK